jgi:hypothetical protein
VAVTLDPLVVKRLAFIRFLHEQGVEQSQRPEPLSATALLSFHDAVESFLLLAAEHLNVNISQKTTFDGYWGEIGAVLGAPLPSKAAMRRMNNLRVNLKHHGSFPSGSNVQQAKADVATFLLDASRLVFDVDFTTLDMIDLVTQADAAEKLREADAQARAGDHVEALAWLRQAFDGLLKDYAARKRSGGNGMSPYDFGATPSSHQHMLLLNARRLTGGRNDTAELASSILETSQEVGALAETIRAMQEGMRVLAVGLDYRRYARFTMLAPTVFGTMDGARHVAAAPGLQVGDQDYAFCRNFVIEAALHLASMDFDLDLVALWQASLAKPATE